MGIKMRNEIGYWFFMILGIVGAFFFTYEFATTEKYGFWEWLPILSAFSVFIFKPMILINVFDVIMNKLSK